MPVCAVEGIVREVAGVVRDGACCGPGGPPPPPPCPWRWRAEICSVPWCPAPSSIYVCSDTPRADGQGVVLPGCVIRDYAHCYLVLDECRYVAGTPGPGECALPAGAVLQSFGSYFCEPGGCASPACEPVAGWLRLVPCDCSPRARCGQPNPPSVVSNRFAECVDYFELVNAGIPCPAARVADDAGNVACLRVDLGQGVVPVLPPGAQVHGLTASSCCDCCADGSPDPGVVDCDHELALVQRQVDCARVVDTTAVCCCRECDVTVVVEYRIRHFSPSTGCLGPPGISPGTNTCVDTVVSGRWRRAPGSDVVTGEVVRTTSQFGGGGPCDVTKIGGAPCVDVIVPPPRLCRLADILPRFGAWQPPPVGPPACVEHPELEGEWSRDCSRYAIDMRQYSPGPGPEDYHVSVEAVGGVTISSALGPCSRCGGAQGVPPGSPAGPRLPGPPPGGGESGGGGSLEELVG